MGRTAQRGDGRIDSSERGQNHAGTTVLPFEFKARRPNLCSSGARALGRREQGALGDGCVFWRGSKPRSRWLRRREFGDAAPTRLEFTEARANQKARYQGQTT